MKKKPVIDLYYAEICGLCHEAMDFLRSRNLAFTKHEVFWDEKNQRFIDSAITREMFERCGGETDFVPQLFINGHHVPGWRKLQKLIESGEFERMLES